MEKTKGKFRINFAIQQRVVTRGKIRTRISWISGGIKGWPRGRASRRGWKLCAPQSVLCLGTGIPYRSFDTLFPGGIEKGARRWIPSSLMKEVRYRGSLIRYSDRTSRWTARKKKEKGKLDQASKTTEHKI